MKETYILSEKELKQAIANYLKIDSSKIDYCGWSGILNFGKFMVTTK